MRTQMRKPEIGDVRARHGFTLLELLLGVAITGIIAAAVASLAFAVGTNWQRSDPTASAELRAGQAAMRLQKVVSSAKLHGLVRTGTSGRDPAAIILWRADDNGDGRIQVSELTLIEHDRATKRLHLYQMQLPSDLTEQELAAKNPTVTYSSITEPTAVEDFKAVAHLTVRALAAEVSGAQFGMHSAGRFQRPTFEFTLQVGPGELRTEYGVATLRGPLAEPEE